MSRFVGTQSRLFKQMCSRAQFVQQQLRYSQQNIEPVVSGKKKYVYTAVLGSAVIGFGYYLKKEVEYGNLIADKLNVDAMSQCLGHSAIEYRR